MSNPILRAFGFSSAKRTVESITPRRTFEDVILPPATRRALDQALVQVTSYNLVFNRWGLGERHPTGLALAFNFAGPSGTGKTICAEAIAHALGRRLLIVRYAEVESMWMGETPKNVAAVFRMAREQNAVLLFDEADAIAARRSSTLMHGFDRESNSVVTVLLQEIETFDGVVIFATNMAANFDPAFERRIRTHVLFEMPGVVERDGILSFFPCLQAKQGSQGFARPEIRLPGIVTATQTQNKKLTFRGSTQEISTIWQEVKRQVNDQGLLLGIHADLPPEEMTRSAPATIPA